MTLPEGLESVETFGEQSVELPPDRLIEVCRFLKDSGFERLSTVTAVDRYPRRPRFELVYHLHSISRKERLRLKTRLDGDSPEIEVHIVKLHVEESLLIGGNHSTRPHIDPTKWRPLIMSFCRFFGLGSEVHPSRLAESEFMKFVTRRAS